MNIKDPYIPYGATKNWNALTSRDKLPAIQSYLKHLEFYLFEI